MEERRKIDRELLQGRSKAVLSREHGVQSQALLYHQKYHLYPQMARHVELYEAETSMNLFREIEELMDQTKQILDEAKANGHNTLALKAIAQLRGNLTLFAQIRAEINRQAMLAEGISPEELEQFRHWKRSQYEEDEGLTTVIDSLSDEQKELFFSINMSQLGETPPQPPQQPEKHPVRSERDTSNSESNSPRRKRTQFQGDDRGLPPGSPVGRNLPGEDENDPQDDVSNDLRVRPIEPKIIPHTPWRSHPMNPRRRE